MSLFVGVYMVVNAHLNGAHKAITVFPTTPVLSVASPILSLRLNSKPFNWHRSIRTYGVSRRRFQFYRLSKSTRPCFIVWHWKEYNCSKFAVLANWEVLDANSCGKCTLIKSGSLRLGVLR